MDKIDLESSLIEFCNVDLPQGKIKIKHKIGLQYF